eukprot:CAMPEP_0174891552 /NCGR_PEP_ID=MMETSP0167-20121228/6620_1 /TAXON_ID=38298 /ORGANISM="Rhodella maculata, Strain CCMP736" /LENGTH=65 /DNA_ID=CAMNT_0016129779 /DNA_START=114 /DNA_END=307 /DNA_ORIENTATION=+
MRGSMEPRRVGLFKEGQEIRGREQVGQGFGYEAKAEEAMEAASRRRRGLGEAYVGKVCASPGGGR